ncbi:hypothetical protein ACM01_05750 [Streptomyces viridochromogenes]|uniref:Uncharacterized protein n=1 Tax=Streptomyces viridochromogenes TaxID=1938 RepID=A0A0J8CE37_STRVR|nr:hypothetical protein [Streptomyces viridochromogenes]KMS76215.1 hypothetical protein ACM01_05750 [Streptomyces viridochromogenes]KOG25043.1 hypothetical protein ADK36_06810 [Streptomyces viridochromogenes]KOG26510.1 hypothetical protein ADK35_07500 [Streptomyces viridochromogenes]
MAQVLAEATLQEIKEHLEVVVDSGRGTTFQGSESVVRNLAEPKELRSLIGQIISDDAALADIAARSYYHANNFLKVVLLAGDKNPWKLRLHMWHPQPNASGTITEDIHSHRWDFTTALVVGEYFAQEFKIGPGTEYYHFKYLPIGQGKTFSLEAQGKEELCSVFEAVLPAGTVYHINHEVLHCISRSAGKAAASLVLQQPAEEDFTNVYRTSPAGEQAKTEIEVQRPSVAQLREELEHFLTWLD